VVVGTHALIQAGVDFRRLRVVVIDEQHRFGVRQRSALFTPGESSPWPHTLHMTATPIPRTLGLTLYGDLDVSVIDESPPGRTPVRTRLFFLDHRPAMWEFVRGKLDEGRQAYVVCPLVEESESLEVASAVATYEELRRGELAPRTIGLIHGQMKSEAKQAVMSAFAAGEIQVLVTTTVIEVGIDVANATVMIIEDAHRFGLSQLHQLRGRVARGGEQGYCFVGAGEADAEDEEMLSRLRLFESTTDGFELAEADLRFRGEGQVFGERQSGWGDLKVARPPHRPRSPRGRSGAPRPAARPPRRGRPGALRWPRALAGPCLRQREWCASSPVRVGGVTSVWRRGPSCGPRATVCGRRSSRCWGT